VQVTHPNQQKNEALNMRSAVLLAKIAVRKTLGADQANNPSKTKPQQATNLPENEAASDAKQYVRPSRSLGK